MSYINRHQTRKRAGSAELVYLLVVLAAGVTTAWWAGHKIGMDLSSITTVASVLGLTETGHLDHGIVGYHPNANGLADQATAAPFCTAGQVPTFALGLGNLKQRLGDTMGAP